MTVLFENKPADFESKTEVVACFCTFNDQLLLLQRASHCSAPGAWALPGGKLEPSESLLFACKRELQEETSINLPETDFQYITHVFVKNEDGFFTFHLFYVELKKQELVVIDRKEHQNFQWISLKDSLHLPGLIGGLSECIVKYYPSQSRKICQ